MAQPAPIYDPDKKKAITRPDLQALEGGGETSPPTGNLSAAPEPTDAGLKEAAPQRSYYKGPGQQTLTSLGLSRFSLRGRLTKRRAILGSGIIGTIIAVFGFTLLSGPLQFIYLAQILGKNWDGQADTANIRTGRLISFARTGDPGELRLGRLGKIVASKAVNNLGAAGITVLEKNIDGKPTKLLFDTAKDPQLKNVPASELTDAVAKKYKMDPRAIKARCCTGRLFELSFNPGKAADLKSLQLIKASSPRANSGRVASAIMSRQLGKFWGIGTLYHPLERAKLAIKGKPAQVITERLKVQETERRKKIYERNQAEVKTTASNVRDAVKGRTAMSALLVTGTLCAVRGVAGDVVKLNRLAIVLPASTQAIDAMAVGAQVQSGQDFDAAQLGPIVNGFKDDKGQTIWQGQALQVLAGNSQASGEDLPANYAQAFSDQTTASNIRNFIDSKIPASGFICSPVGIGLQLIAGAAAIAASVESGGVSAQAYFALKTTASFAATAGSFYLISNLLEDMIKDKAVVPELMSGPLGGNILAYGARAASNTVAISSGGAELVGSVTSAYDDKYQLQDQREFQSKGIASRLFDVHDYRSIISRLIDNTSPSPTQNFAKMASIFTNFGGFISNMFSNLLPHARAAPQPYNWGFPRYGIPQSVAEDPKYEDPYASAEAAVDLLKSDGSYKDRVEKCFGVAVNEEDGWSVTAESEVNPADSNYINANCSDTSDNWHRIQLFVFDSRLMDSTACYEGDDQSCTDLGFGGSADAGSPDGAIDQGTNAELAQKILDYKKTGQYNCDNAGDCLDLEKVVKGQSLAGSDGCVAQTLDPRVLQLILYAIESGNFRVGTYALCGDHSSDSPRGHSGGFAIDFSTVNGTAVVARSASARSTTLALATFLHNLSGQLAPRQLITAGSGGQFDQAFLDLEIPDSATFGGRGGTNIGHTNHIHVGY